MRIIRFYLRCISCKIGRTNYPEFQVDIPYKEHTGVEYKRALHQLFELAKEHWSHNIELHIFHDIFEADKFKKPYLPLSKKLKRDKNGR